MASIRDPDVREFLSAGTRTGKVAWVGQDGAPHVAPIWFVLDGVRRFATTIGGRYMGEDRAEEFGARNGVPGELLVRLLPTEVRADLDVSG